MASESLVTGRNLPELSEGEAVKWLDTITLSCATKPSQVFDELPGIVGGITELLRGKIHTAAEDLHLARMAKHHENRKNRGEVSEGRDVEKEEKQQRDNVEVIVEEPSLEFRPTPLYASLFQAVATLSNHVGGGGGCMPKSGELFLSLLALAAVTPHYSQSAFIAAKSILRQAEGRGLFTLEQYSSELHAWLKSSLLRGWGDNTSEFFQGEEGGTTRGGVDALYAQHEITTAVEERKIAFYCLDRMVQRRNGVVSILSISSGDLAGTNYQSVNSRATTNGTQRSGDCAIDAVMFLELLLDLSTVVHDELVPMINAIQGTPGQQVPGSPSSSPDYYLSVATDFIHRVRKLSLEMKAKKIAIGEERDERTTMFGNDLRSFVSPTMSGLPEVHSAGSPLQGHVSRTLAFEDGGSSPIPQVPAGGAAAGGENIYSPTTKPQPQQTQHPAIPTLKDIRAGGRAGDAAGDGGDGEVAAPTGNTKNIAEARMAAAQCLQTVKLFGGKGGRQTIEGPQAFAIMEEYKESRETEMEALSVRLATLKARNARLANEVARNDKTLALLHTTDIQQQPKDDSGKDITTATVSLEVGIERLENTVIHLEATLTTSKEKNETEIKKLYDFLRQEEMEHFSQSIQIETKYGKEIARRAKELALLEQTKAAAASP